MKNEFWQQIVLMLYFIQEINFSDNPNLKIGEFKVYSCLRRI